MKKTIISAAVLAFCSAAAFANPISLTAVNGNLYQQGEQNPCIFSNSACKQPSGFLSADLDNGGNVGGYDALSPVYSGSTLLGIIGSGNALQIGLDINQDGDPQTLTGFTMIKNGSVVDTFSFAGMGNVPKQNNGNGYADYLLGNFSPFIGTDTIQFHFIFNNANDGTENLFLIGAPGTPTPTPEPASLALLGSGLLFIAAKFRKKAKS